MFRGPALWTAILIVWPLLLSADAADWPQWRGPGRDGVWGETKIVERLPQQLKYCWRVPIGGGFAGPAVAGQRVYVADRVVDVGETVPESRWNVTDPVQGRPAPIERRQLQGRQLVCAARGLRTNPTATSPPATAPKR